MKKHCNECGSEVRLDAKFCRNCGNKLKTSNILVEEPAKEKKIVEQKHEDLVTIHINQIFLTGFIIGIIILVLIWIVFQQVLPRLAMKNVEICFVGYDYDINLLSLSAPITLHFTANNPNNIDAIMDRVEIQALLNDELVKTAEIPKTKIPAHDKVPIDVSFTITAMDVGGGIWNVLSHGLQFDIKINTQYYIDTLFGSISYKVEGLQKSQCKS